MPQEANFSLIGRFGNCPLVVRMAVARSVIREAPVGALASWTDLAPDDAGLRGCGAIPSQGLAAGCTTCCSTRVRRPGSEPARSIMAMLFASSSVKLPEI